MKEQRKNILFQLSPHLFWNCDVSKLDYKKNKKMIIKRIIEYGMEMDEIFMWKMYSYRDIKYTAINMSYLPYLRILYYSFLLGIKENRFKCYKNKSFQWN